MAVELSYYYGYEAEQFSFYRIPKLLFTDSRFSGISTDAKLLYGITLTTKLGTRTYEVYSVQKILSTQVSVLDASHDNIITLVTCVMDQPEYRWCVQAKMV